jgi:hypothetical protein
LKILSNDSIEKEEITKTNRENIVEKSVSPQLRHVQSSHSDSELKTPRFNGKIFSFF